MRAMILAAGFGQRMLPLTEHTPKALLKVAGEPLIVHHLLQFAAMKLERVVINLGHLGIKIRDYLGDGHTFGLDIRYSEEWPPLETGGGIANALPLLGPDPFIVVNADIYTAFCYDTLTTLNASAHLAHLVLVDNPVWHAQGDFILQHDRIVAQGIGAQLTFSGLSVLHPDLFKHCLKGTFPLAPLLRRAIANNHVTGEHYTGMWHNVGTVQEFTQLKGEATT